MDGVFQWIGGAFSEAVQAGRDILIARAHSAEVEDQEAAKMREARASNEIDLRRFRLIVIGLIGFMAALLFIRRARA